MTGAAGGGWRLRPVAPADVPALHAIACEPEVWRYMFDGVAPAAAFVADWVAARCAEAAAGLPGPGARVLAGADGVPRGWCVIQPGPERRAELGYALHPGLWGRGLATRMAWTMLEAAFAAGWREVWAGTDGPNTASRRVMERAGMRFLRPVDYPLGPGVAFLRRAGDPPPRPVPEPLPLA